MNLAQILFSVIVFVLVLLFVVPWIEAEVAAVMSQIP